MTKARKPRARKRPPALSVERKLENQTLNLIEGEALELYTTEYSPDDLIRARRRAAKVMRLPELLDAVVIEKPKKPESQGTPGPTNDQA